ncbi:MAG: aminopeptidase [Candidatus Nanohaloarchaea archaeon]|nr:aminopeptidase [Candidatus Nanohaloarchaea archaeon]
MKEMEEELSFKKQSGWEKDVDRDEVEELSDKYKEFLAQGKTEREAAELVVEKAKEEGFKDVESMDEFEKGAKVYAVNRGKEVILAVLGDDLEDIKMTISHLDSPRLDLKQRPLYEASDLALMDTHYYGGIKNYQWVNVPLALHGTVIDSDGDKHEIVVGEDDDDPVFLVPDLLPHLGKEQLKKELKDAIEAEELNIVVGNMPVDDEEVEKRVKLSVLKHLNDEHDLDEEDLISAEFEAVPALEPRDLGFDRSMIAAYGQDDKGHCFTTMEAILDSDPENTAIACFFDKEEIGSEGNTSAQSRFLEKFVKQLMTLSGSEPDAGIYGVFDSMEVLSTDVSAAVNPTFAELHDEKNAMSLGQGVSIVKFTGSGGKYSANDSHAEFVGKVRNLLNEEDIPWGPVELGKVGKGGGGTVAKFIARRGADVLDLGFTLISMHSPYEVCSKVDVYHTYQACKKFLEAE